MICLLLIFEMVSFFSYTHAQMHMSHLLNTFIPLLSTQSISFLVVNPFQCLSPSNLSFLQQSERKDHTASGRIDKARARGPSRAEIQTVQMLANFLADALNDAIHFNSVSE